MRIGGVFKDGFHRPSLIFLNLSPPSREWIYQEREELKSKMVTEAPLPTASPDRRGVRNMLILFAILGIAGVFLLAFSVVLGIIVLVVAEAFFLMAYRTFARRSPRPDDASQSPGRVITLLDPSLRRRVVRAHRGKRSPQGRGRFSL